MTAGTYDKDGKLITWQQHIDSARAEGALTAKRDIIDEILTGMTRQERQDTITKILELYGYG